MKRVFSFLLCIVIAVSFTYLDVCALDSQAVTASAVDVSTASADNSARVSGLITSYGLQLSHTGTTLNIYGVTYCIVDVVKCGYKNLTIERRKSSSDSWKDYYEYGDVYSNAASATLSTTLTVERGYQYRISCKHYAKKSLLVTQNVSNVSNIVTVE